MPLCVMPYIVAQHAQVSSFDRLDDGWSGSSLPVCHSLLILVSYSRVRGVMHDCLPSVYSCFYLT